MHTVKYMEQCRVVVWLVFLEQLVWGSNPASITYLYLEQKAYTHCLVLAGPRKQTEQRIKQAESFHQNQA